MRRRVLVAPAPLQEIEHVYGPILRGAGYTIEYPPRDHVETELQMTEDGTARAAPRVRRVAGRQRAVHPGGHREGRRRGAEGHRPGRRRVRRGRPAGRHRPRRRRLLRPRDEPGGGRRARLHADARADPQRAAAGHRDPPRQVAAPGGRASPAARRSASSASAASARRWRRGRTPFGLKVLATEIAPDTGSARPTASRWCRSRNC